MIVPATLAAALLLAAPPADGTMTLSATLSADKLDAGGEYGIDLHFALADGWSCTDSGIRSAFLQIDPPDGVELTDKVDPNAAREFVMQPWEREIKPGDHTIKFRLDAAPAAGATIGLNIIAYLNEKGSDDHFFFRRRLEVPLEPRAAAVEGDPANTRWGRHDTLFVGDKPDDFTLPQFGGTELTLGDYLGSKNIIITTYRAYW